jgi:hypothetical protein
MSENTTLEVVDEYTTIELIEESTIVDVIDEIIDIIEVGIQGPPGIQGAQGPSGEGMPPGGNAGDILSKNSDENYDLVWIEDPYNRIVNRYDSNNDGKINHAEFADLAKNSNFVDGKDINNYYTKGQVDLITQKYVYNQSTPSTYWVLNHYLNRYPNVVITDSAGSVLEGSIIHLNLNTTVIQFNIPISGKASLS